MKFYKRYTHFSANEYKNCSCVQLDFENSHCGIYFIDKLKWGNNKGAAISDIYGKIYYFNGYSYGTGSKFKSNKEFRKYLKLLVFQ